MASHTKSNPEWHVDIIWYKSRLCSVDMCLLNVIIAIAWLYNLFAWAFITSPYSLCSQRPGNIRVPSNFHFKLGNNSTVSTATQHLIHETNKQATKISFHCRDAVLTFSDSIILCILSIWWIPRRGYVWMFPAECISAVNMGSVRELILTPVFLQMHCQ